MFRNIVQRASRTQRLVQQRWYSSQQPPTSSGAPSLPAMLAVASMGFCTYYILSKAKHGDPVPQRKKIEPVKQIEVPKLETVTEPAPVEETTPVPAFSTDDVTVVFVLGGPGAGKGTQCENLIKDYGFVHLSAGDLLRAEQKREGSKYGELINHYIREGLIVPMEVTIALLEQAMRDAMAADSKATRFLIDGFPRKMDQAIKFEEVVVPSKMVLYFECPEEVMLKRLLKRGESSGRVDDNIESIKKRFRVFTETSFPVIEAFETQNKVQKVSCDKAVEDVYGEVKVIFDKLFA
ncbi:bifunctional uridylate/adenylate kinase [Apophysomyces sp. BC1034]|nr:bifunctional uridylate/adenylate kinase [Apophysomyces sp. BC1015]KAG0180390.1 bifunctional uridylate/adenylate kinase [Apophysomyces sp. BC1021]KAG0190943.1 bifunctional uridylate/adenylate kinase [Apophysomyces sp. BC1034]